MALIESQAGGLLPGDLTGKQNLYYARAANGLVVAGVPRMMSGVAGWALPFPRRAVPGWRC